jgi:hypothetical protein
LHHGKITDNRAKSPRSRGGSITQPLEGLCVSGLRMVPVKPQAQFFELLGCKRVYRAFNVL